MGSSKVLITGAAGGLGSALTHAFAARGSDLLLTDKNSRALDALSDLLVDSGHQRPGVCALDLAAAGEQQFAELAGILQSEYGGLDTLIHSAATFSGLSPIEQFNASQWQEHMNVNVLAAAGLFAACKDLLKNSARGQLVLIMDEPAAGSAYWGAYGVSKGALAAYSKILAEELHGTGIELVCFAPQPMRTSLRASAYVSEAPESLASPESMAEKLITQLF